MGISGDIFLWIFMEISAMISRKKWWIFCHPWISIWTAENMLLAHEIATQMGHKVPGSTEAGWRWAARHCLLRFFRGVCGLLLLVEASKPWFVLLDSKKDHCMKPIISIYETYTSLTLWSIFLRRTLQDRFIDGVWIRLEVRSLHYQKPSTTITNDLITWNLDKTYLHCIIPNQLDCIHNIKH